MPTDLEIYLFDLRGYVILPAALSSAEVADLNSCLDAIPELEPGEWYGYVHAHSYGETVGLNLQQIYEAGEPFERLIDHPSWIDKVKLFVGGAGTFDYMQGPLFIDEVFANLRGTGNAIGMHSGADCHIKRNQYRYRNGNFMVCQVNVLIALTDIKPGDGGTVIIPASHNPAGQLAAFLAAAVTTARPFRSPATTAVRAGTPCTNASRIPVTRKSW